MGKILCRFQKCNKNLRRFLVLEINTFELVAGISLNTEDKTCDRSLKC